MKLFIDTADLDEIREIASWGVLSGATTNPALLAKQGGSPEDVLRQICEMVDGPVSAEVVATQHEEMIEQALHLADIHPNIVIKVPITVEGLKAVHELSSRGIACNVTLVFSVPQALLAARAGARFVSPFVGRIDDRGAEGMEMVREMAEAFAIAGIGTEIITASVRHPRHVVEAALAGSHIATLPPDTFKKMIQHPLTDLGLEAFMQAWQDRFGDEGLPKKKP